MSILNNLKPLVVPVAKPVETELVIPEFPLEAGAGVSTDNSTLFMALIRNHGNGNVRGAAANLATGFHRIDVVRWADITWAGMTEADAPDLTSAERWMRVGPGRAEYDTVFRPMTRMSLRMFQNPPASLGRDHRPIWLKTYKLVGQAINWARKEAAAEYGPWIGLVMVVSRTDLKTVETERYGTFNEASILGVQALELVKLERFSRELVMDQSVGVGSGDHSDVAGLAE